MAQTSYSINIGAVSYPGQPADIAPNRDFVTAAAVAAPIPYGVLVVTDTSHGNPGNWETAGRLPASSGDITTLGSILGVSTAEQTFAQNPAFSVPTYAQYAAVPCMRVGRIWVLVEEAVTEGTQAYVRYAAGTFTQLGAFRSDSDTSTAAACPNAYYRTSQATPGGYAIVELSFV